jgi:hypothetical protein
VSGGGTLTNAAGGLIQVNAGSGGDRILTGDLTNAGTLNVGAGSTFTVRSAMPTHWIVCKSIIPFFILRPPLGVWVKQ